jgi:arylesterase/paraoxonase
VAKRVSIILLVLILSLAGYVLRVLYQAGQFRSIEPHFEGSCRHVGGPMGVEDLTIHPDTGLVYLSASDRRALDAGRPVPGGIYAYDLNDPAAGPVNLTPEADLGFQPHGISLWVGEGGRDALFVINHPVPASGRPTHGVEVFDLVDGALRHRLTWVDEALLVMPNDLVAVGPDRFYLTNTHAHPPGPAQTRETFLQRPGAVVLLHDGERFRPALENLVFPNGINRSPDGRTLYLATTTPRTLQVYDRDVPSERLTLREEIFMGSGLDNIEVDASGALWIGSHPKLLAVGSHREDPTVPSPSQVFRVTPEADGGHRVEEIYLDDGREFAAASVAAARGQRLLIGSIFGEGILDCSMQAASP